ncbi:MAG: hypothetical protein V1738_02995 [Patescibacteria group bacterium]
MQLTADRIIELLTAAGNIAADELPEDVERYREMIANRFLPTVAGLLDQPVTLQSLFEVKDHHMRFCLQMKMVDPGDPDPEFEEEINETMDIFSFAVIRMIEEIERLKLNPEELVLSEMGLSDDNLNCLRAGTFTIGNLLNSQPEIILEGP